MHLTLSLVGFTRDCRLELPIPFSLSVAKFNLLDMSIEAIDLPQTLSFKIFLSG